MRYPVLVALACVAATACSGDQQQDSPFEPAFAAGREVFVQLSGANEVPPNASTATGTFMVTLSGNTTLCYVLTASGLSAPLTGAHIHRGPATGTGGIVVHLQVPTGGESSECVEVDKALFKDIRKDPGAFYVNVHTTMYPAGEIRAQLDS